MPIYKYKCNNDHITTRLISINNTHFASIPCDNYNCSETAKRIFGISSIKTDIDLLNEAPQDTKKRYNRINKDKNFGDK